MRTARAGAFVSSGGIAASISSGTWVLESESATSVQRAVVLCVVGSVFGAAGVIIVAMCKIAQAAIAPRLATQLLQAHLQPEEPKPPLRLVADDPPPRASGG